MRYQWTNEPTHRHHVAHALKGAVLTVVLTTIAVGALTVAVMLGSSTAAHADDGSLPALPGAGQWAGAQYEDEPGWNPRTQGNRCWGDDAVVRCADRAAATAYLRQRADLNLGFRRVLLPGW